VNAESSTTPLVGIVVVSNASGTLIPVGFELVDSWLCVVYYMNCRVNVY